MNSTLLVNAIRFFSRGQKCLLSFLRILKQVLKEENIKLNCLDQVELEVEMSAAPPGCDFPDAAWTPRLREYEQLVCEKELSETLLHVPLEKMLKKSFSEFGKQFPEQALAPQQVGLLLRPILLEASSTSMSPTIADMGEVPASVLSSASTESPPKTSILNPISRPLLGVKRGPTYDPSTESKSKTQRIITSPIFSSKYLVILIYIL